MLISIFIVRPPDEISREKGAMMSEEVKPDAVENLMRALASLDLFVEREDGRFALAPLAGELLP